MSVRRPIRRRAAAFLLPLTALVALAGPWVAIAAAAGPPFPLPENDRAVYDTAEVLRPETRTQVEQTIDAIEQRTGAEVVVYTQTVPCCQTTEEAEADAQALMDQWGVGRKGFDDGLVILFNLNEGDTCHGQVQLYAGPGFRAKFLTNEERQKIFEDDMLPLLRGCDLDGALLAAMAKVDAAATPEHAGQLAFFRQLNAVIGLLVAPLVAAGIVLWGLASWFRHGRDPVYLDDPSIHIPAPPAGLTPAAGAVIREGRSTRRALTAASLDLAARGMIAFQAEKTGLLGTGTKLGILTRPETNESDAVDVSGRPLPPGPPGTEQLDAESQWRRDRARSRPLDPATQFLDSRITGIGGIQGYIDSTEMLRLGSDVSGFDKRIEQHVVANGWFKEPPATSTRRWVGRGSLAIAAGVISLVVGFNLPSDGLVVLGGAVLAAGIVLLLLARSMPSVTMPGAMIRAMLEAYRRTLEKTMAQARSMNQVVAESAIPLIESPDDAVVWGVALGLQSEVEQVLERTADDLQQGRVQSGYMPIWYTTGGSGFGGDGRGGSGGFAPGLMSSSPIPNFGGMMAALGTIGNSPSSSGSGGGGGFGGGGSGGGGGGAGGGF
jgi:uncharacterized membrane protein YgcG